MRIAVVGLGHIGLPLAAQYAGKGHRVFGCDIDPAVVAMVGRGDAYPDEAGLEARVREAGDAGRLSAQTTTTEAVRQAEVVIVIVPLVVDRDKRIDYRAIDAATADVAAGLQPGSLVVYETTLPVGDTRTRFGPALERGSGLAAGRDFSLAFSPERVYVGRVFEDLCRYPKVVGGIDAESTRRATAFFRAVLDAEVLAVSNAETAEFTKLAETTYRDVNIALANEFARYAEEVGVDAMQAIDAANTQPFSHIHRPGIGVGGHCIPVYPYFYANRTRHAELARLARRVNDEMADHAVERLADSLGGLTGRSVAVLGYAYREDVKEDAFTVAERLVERLRERRARVLVHDSLFDAAELRHRGLDPFSLAPPEAVDALVVQAGHAEYRDLDFEKIPGLRVMFDGRNVLDPSRVPAGVRYLSVGRGEPAPRSNREAVMVVEILPPLVDVVDGRVAGAPPVPSAAAAPARSEYLPFARPLIAEEEIAAVVETLRSGWLTMGPRTREFEQEFAAYVGAGHAVAVNSATAGLHLALEAIGLEPGDEVITTPYTFAATAAVVRHLEARPVFVDIRPTDLNIDPDRLEAALSPRTRAILPVHVAGQPCAMDEILDLAARHDLRVIEDAAHALPTRYRGRMIGTIGDLTVFSFYATKNLTTGEGGMVTTEDPRLAERMRVMRLHGISADAWKRYTAAGSWYYEITAPGFKYNMTDIAAAIGLCQLAKVEAMAARRAEIAARYTAAFVGDDTLEPPWVNPEGAHAWHLYILRLHLDRLTLGRAEFIDGLRARNIGTSVHFIPLHLHPYYREREGYTPAHFPVAAAEYERVISLPIYAAMSDQDVDDVISAVLDVARRGKR